ncbi:MAG: hypothetical protein R3F56_05315 [Planctomycetota bacterium]
MPTSRPGLWSLVLVPALVTLLVTGLRLYGEMQDWNPSLFSRAAGGGGALVGISWLVLLFGFWFGWRLRRGGERVGIGRALALYLVAGGVFAGGVWALTKFQFVVFPQPEAPGKPTGMPYMLGLMGLVVLVSLAAWPRLTLTLIAYGLLARIPVVVITWFAVQNDWGSHYDKLGPGVAASTTMEKFLFLSMAQVTFWPFVFTTVAGGVVGSLGAALAGKGRQDY